MSVQISDSATRTYALAAMEDEHMTKQDTENLFALLAIYFPNNPRVRDARLKSAWHLLLEPFSAADVKKAVVECLRESSFFPDPQTVAAKCRPAAVEVNRVSDDAKILAQLQRLRQKMRGEPI